jgi:hypothetical protein
LTAPHSAAILSDMKGWIFVLGFSLALAAPAGAQAPADWRSQASERDTDLVLGWEALLDLGIERARQLPASRILGTDFDTILELKQGGRIAGMPYLAQGDRTCRVFELGRRLATVGDDHVCRILTAGSVWHLRKTTGEIRFEGRFYSDPNLGVVFLGDWWTDAERGIKRETGAHRRAVGVLREQSPARLLLHFSNEYTYRIVQIDLAQRPVIARPPGR